jgi:hypothetical protein
MFDIIINAVLGFLSPDMVYGAAIGAAITRYLTLREERSSPGR